MDIIKKHSSSGGRDDDHLSFLDHQYNEQARNENIAGGGSDFSFSHNFEASDYSESEQFGGLENEVEGQAFSQRMENENEADVFDADDLSDHQEKNYSDNQSRNFVNTFEETEADFAKDVDVSANANTNMNAQNLIGDAGQRNANGEIYGGDIGDEEKLPTTKKVFWGKLLMFVVALGCLAIGGKLYIEKGEKIRSYVLGVSQEASGNIDGAVNGIKNGDFATSADKFKEAYDNFADMSESLSGLGKGVISIARFVPGVSKLSSGYYLSESGKELSLAGEKIAKVIQKMDDLKKNGFVAEDGESKTSLLEVFQFLEKNTEEIQGHLKKAEDDLEKVNLKDLPDDKRKIVAELKNKLPIISEAVTAFSNNGHIVADLLGANGPRKYLFLLQNNQEIRATGGFIGSYGILSIDGHGRINNFFVDGIFNPDGQLFEKIVPPKPIQKISIAWSMHDSNWFPDFPLSARKAMLFYEKTGGPTVDGVIAVTPTVLQKLLKVTGPIAMDDYGVVLTSDNFVQNIQYKVEEDYDKEENRPKKILADLTPLVIKKIFSNGDAKTIFKAAEVLNESLMEKQILLYFNNEELQKIVSDLGWSGEVLQTKKDYLSVINTNINGYKTDGVVSEKIEHQAEVRADGSVIDTVIITREHHGGHTRFEWWNKVNADYMRVYVPQGSKLLSVEGQTKEINESPVDYNTLGFKRDKDVVAEESGIKIDEASGTRIYDEFGKTVFANWVYVSPQEKVVVKYKYLLPFKIAFSEENPVDSYSLLAQKQSGSLGSKFDFSIVYPSNYQVEWRSDKLSDCNNSADKENKRESKLCFEGDLVKDKFLGVVWSVK